MMKRRMNDEGRGKKLSSGSDRWQVTLGLDERARPLRGNRAGKMTMSTPCPDELPVADHQPERLPIPSHIRLADWLPLWLDLKRPILAPKTLANYAYVIDRHLSPLLGHHRLQDLKASEVRAAYVELANQGFSKSLLHQVRVILRQALQEAVFDEIVLRNAAEVARLPSFRRGKTARALNAKEVRAFLEAAHNHRLGLLFEFVIASGLRRGEVCALRWTHLDLDMGQLRVRENITVVNGKATLGTPKTESGIRDLHLAPETVSLLRRQLLAQQAEGLRGASHVFTNIKGQRLYPDSLTKLAGKIAEQARLGDVRFHDLRHTYASLMLSMGVPMEVISEKLGHSRPSTTADIYRHVFVEEHERHTFALGDLLTPKPLRIRSAARRADHQEENERVA
ncbi:tyrosine-type recombinase/integrase [Deinococcus sonorensis]|uniref:Tyrosine-type recombinase/integrase n=2 Tax=Deinococcus sonorensis TaxID=309891 RepID=A0AAU7UEX3_9DEIO